MQFFYWIVLWIVVGIAVFAIQKFECPSRERSNSFLWSFETSLVYTILGSIGLGIIMTLLFWIPRAIRSSFSMGEGS